MTPATVRPQKPRKSRWRRRALAVVIVSTALVAGGTVALHELPWLGPLAADGARKVVGPGPVAWVEDVVYGAEDVVNVALRSDEAPKVFWSQERRPLEEALEGSAPADFEPPYDAVSAVGDGVWAPMRAITDPSPVALHKTLVHPDPKRPFAAVAIVAMELTALELALVAGVDEPESDRVPSTRRPGLVPRADLDELVAVFNGGFKAIHGRYGMRVDDDTFLPPREGACTISIEARGVEIGTYSNLAVREAKALRQAPPCLVEHGAVNPALQGDLDKGWGASVSGQTIIRRSALGLSSDRRRLFYGLGDAVSARSLGEAMRAAGATDVAQLDVNQAFPRFLLVERSEGTIEAKTPLIPDIRYSPSDYVGKPSDRDFFYVRRRRSD